MGFTDLCVSAALDAVKERVELPWNLATSNADGTPTLKPSTEALTTEGSDPNVSPLGEPAPETTRVLSLRNFTKALKEIVPSSSEALGSLADLRKWNDEFGEGKKDKKKRQVWGKDRFGFTDQTEKLREEGRVTSIDSSQPKAAGVEK